VRTPGEYALLWANGMPFNELFALHAEDLSQMLGDEDQFEAARLLRKYADEIDPC
jgi:hypothetical protein